MSDTTPTPEEFDRLPRLDAIPAEDVERWLTMSRDEREVYAEANGLGSRIRAFVDEHGRSQVWYPTSSSADYDVLDLVDGELRTVPGHLVAEAEAREAARA